MRSDTLLATLPDLSARIMRDALHSQLRIGWDRFCSYSHLRPIRLDGGAVDVLAQDELQMQRGFADVTARDPNLWVEMGLKYRAMKYGTLGLAMMTTRTLGEGMEIACRYQELTYSLINYRLVKASNGSCALLGEHGDMPEQLQDFSQHRDLGAIRTLIADLTGGGLPLESVAVAAPVPANWEALRRLFPCRVEFDAPQTQWRFQPGSTDAPLPLADCELMDLYSSKCDRLLSVARASTAVSQRLRSILDVSSDSFPSAGQVAELLALSERTLHRRLAEEGTRFSALVDDARYRRARRLLADRGQSVEEIAYATGFAETSSFSRAFKRWSGKGALEYRKSLGSARSNQS